MNSYYLTILVATIMMVALVSAPFGALAQLSEADLINANVSGPVFLDAFWTDRTTAPAPGTALSKVEVGPGDGAAVLAVTLVNRGLSDITSVTGTLTLPSGFTSPSMSSQVLASYNGIVAAGNTFTLFFQVNISDNASVQSYNTNLKVEYSRTLETGAQRTTDVNVPFKLAGKIILDASSEGGIAPGTTANVAIKIANLGSAPATGVVVTVPSSSGINPTTQLASLVAVGKKSFEIGTILPGTTTTIIPMLYASNAAGETLQTVTLQVEYSNTYGEKKNSTLAVGLVVLPTSSHSPLSASPISNSSVITAGKITDLKISLVNSGNQPLSNVAASISSTAEQIKILGKTSWTVGDLAPGASQEISTQVFSSTDMIGKAATFKLTVQRTLAGQPQIEPFDIGTYVDGEINVKVYEMGVTNIGGVPNITGNLLNEGNVLARFTTVEVTNASGLADPLPPQQYLGDLQENSPLPFSIPIHIDNKTRAGTYPLELQVQYKDNLRALHTVDVKTNIDFKPEAPMQDTQKGQAGNTMIIGVIVGIVAAVVIVMVVIRIRKRSKLKDTLRFSKNPNGDGSSNKDDIESVLDSHLSRSSKKEEKG